MKKSAFILAFVALFVFSSANFALADPEGWSNDTRITFAPSDSLVPSLATDPQGNVHIAWVDDRDGNSEIYYKKLNNNGVALTPDVRLTFDSFNTNSPSLATDLNGNVHIAWVDRRDGGTGAAEIYYKKLNNSGAPLTPDVRLTFAPFNSGSPSLATDLNGNVHIAWSDFRNGNYFEVYYKKLNNSGAPLTPDVRLTTPSIPSGYPSLATDPEGNVHIAWEDYRIGTYPRIYYKKLNNSGAPITPDLRLTFDSPYNIQFYLPSLATDPEGNVHVAWYTAGYNAEIYYKKLSNNGTNLTGEMRLTAIRRYLGEPSIATDPEGNVHVAWEDSRNYNEEVYYKKLNNSGAPLTPDVRLTFAPFDTYSYDPSLATDSAGNVHVAWANWNSTGTEYNNEIYYKRSLPTVLTIMTSSLSPAVLGQFTSDQLTAAGGIPPYSWSLVNGTIPSGVSLYPNGVLNGTPANAGNFMFTLGVADRNNSFADKTVTKEVYVTLPPPLLRIRKTGTTAVPGRILDYFIIVENLGNFPAQNVVVDEYIEKPLFNLTSTNPPAFINGNESYPLEVVSWNIPTLVPFETRVFEYRAKLNDSTPIGTEVVGGPACANTMPPPSNQTGMGSWRPLPLPSAGYKIVSGFDCVLLGRDAHKAVDIQAAIGTNVSAIAPGEIYYARDFGPVWRQCWPVPVPCCGQTLYGLTVIIKHANNEYSTYAHLSSILVNRSQRVATGQLIGYSGVSGAGGCAGNLPLSIGPHLHFGYFRGGILDSNGINPCDRLDRIANSGACTCAVGGICYEHKQNATRPVDPNEKEVIATRFIQSNQLLAYPIHFENIGNVSALDVFVDDVLDRNINYSTVQVLSPNGTFNQQTGLVRWELYGINLEPNATGVVMFSAKPKQGLSSGTPIKNNATIQFEIFERVTTNTVENIIDDVSPSCTMRPLPNITASLGFTVSWDGADAIGEIDDYSIFASIDDGAFNQFVSTRQTNATFIGEQGRTYKFICIATDTAGNVEVQSPIAEAQTRIPGASLQLLGVPRIGTTVNLSASDWAHPGNKYILALSLGTSPGIPLGDGRIIPLNLDPLFLLSLQAGQVIGLRDYVSFINPQGFGTTYWDIPNIPELNGITVYAAFVVLDHTLPIPFASISNAVPIRIQA